jgi:quinol-cytochrome oxidoreductase complex cytochrome b subunit
MRYVKIIIFIMYLIVYGYSAHMTSVQPNETIWPYICLFLFPLIFWRIIAYIISIPEKKSDDSIAN